MDTGFVLAVKGVPLMAPKKEEELAKRESVHSVMGRFSHENLVAYYGSGIQRGSLFVSVENGCIEVKRLIPFCRSSLNTVPRAPLGTYCV